ncbi:hypothetical protein H5410_044207 [Solanum commersonii]|uniref:Uncharacterized protein n=1 Tax=Solanum commersonii TaxID=4109 RepID=A0A9J5X8G4_SOLCO|nr:hypothetical protein H5410_044207 [Solanum commersonii]
MSLVWLQWWLRLPSGQSPATVTAPDSDMVPVANPTIPAAIVTPPADILTEPEPDSAPAASVAPPADITNTGQPPSMMQRQ